MWGCNPIWLKFQWQAVTNTIRNKAKRFTNYRTRKPSGKFNKAKRIKDRNQSKIGAPGEARL